MKGETAPARPPRRPAYFDRFSHPDPPGLQQPGSTADIANGWRVRSTGPVCQRGRACLRHAYASVTVIFEYLSARTSSAMGEGTTAPSTVTFSPLRPSST